MISVAAPPVEHPLRPHVRAAICAAIGAAADSLRLQAVRDRAASHILLGTIHVDAGDVDAGLEAILKGAENETANGSTRLSGQLQSARTLIHVRAPGSAAARTIDARIEELQLI
ncbi:hypothetical protein [Nocardia sp. BMG51109]|uniref:hypothetical protein n=1 Tax=Nocardia sp. BMG51109 TaxID=1056816 RepID=UPI0012EBA040|nr:hypothetical protein [Nocardia sp. BMG51109]